MAMEPGVLLGPMEDTMLGAQISFALHRPVWLAGSDTVDATRPMHWASSILMLRPGGYHTVTLRGKVLSRKPLYRYHISEFNPSGREQTPVRRPLDPFAGNLGTLPVDVHQFLRSLRQWCDVHQVRLAYSLPW